MKISISSMKNNYHGIIYLAVKALTLCVCVCVCVCVCMCVCVSDIHSFVFEAT